MGESFTRSRGPDAFFDLEIVEELMESVLDFLRGWVLRQ
jgi:hypothetical protein